MNRIGMGRAWLPSISLVALVLASCGPSAVDREDGVRAPLTSRCGDPEEIRCLLPWPSNAFTRLDDGTKTGVRLAIDPGVIDSDDDPGPLLVADGFSRVTPIVFGFRGAPPPAVDALAGQVWLVEAPTGARVPVHVRLQTHGDENLVQLWPRRPLAANTDHVVAVGTAVPSTRASLVALDRVAPETPEEAELRAYHAPTRRALARANVDPDGLSRVWDFTTRSPADVTPRLSSMAARAREAARTAEVVIDDVTLHDDARAATVEGRLLAMPRFAPRGQAWTLGDDGLPELVDTADVNFRVVIPAGSGDYPVSMYGHGLIGNFRDKAFDEGIAEIGLAKVAVTFHGWNDTDIADTFAGLERMFLGMEVAAARLAQGMADAAAVRRALGGALGDALSAPTLGGQPNPAAGRRPDVETVVWTGASLGAIVGAVYSVLDEDVQAAVLNVPGAGWTQIVPESEIFQFAANNVLTGYETPLDLSHALAMSQVILDDVDPSVWLDASNREPPVALLQESLGDRVLPNQGSELLAAAFGATQVGEVLAPVPGLSASPGPLANATGLTQFRVTSTELLEVHGFAARDTVAGEAAREQIRAFLRSALAGAPVISLPDACVGGSCDFTKH